MKIYFIVFFLFLTGTTVTAQSGQEKRVFEDFLIKIDKNVSISGELERPTHTPKTKLFIILVSPPRFSDRDLISAESPNSKSSGFFKGLSENLVELGSVVFRFDNRGVGLSGGNNDSITIFSHANDVKKIVTYFKSNKEFKNYKFCLVGYSEGGAVSQVVASKLKEIDFLILLSSSGYGGWEFFKYQTKKYYETRGSMFGVEKMTDSLFRANELVQLSLYDTLN